MFRFAKQVYSELLPLIVPSTTIIGLFSGMHTSFSEERLPLILFTNTVGFTSVGMITGILFPISFPILGGYVMYRQMRKK